MGDLRRIANDIADRAEAARRRKRFAEREKKSPRGRGIHIEAPGQDAEWERSGPSLIVMLCGLVLTIADPGGEVSPQGEDFYGYVSGHKAECPKCLEAWLNLECPG